MHVHLLGKNNRVQHGHLRAKSSTPRATPGGWGPAAPEYSFSWDGPGIGESGPGDLLLSVRVGPDTSALWHNAARTSVTQPGASAGGHTLVGHLVRPAIKTTR
jgi:hypothetical protein